MGEFSVEKGMLEKVSGPVVDFKNLFLIVICAKKGVSATRKFRFEVLRGFNIC